MTSLRLESVSITSSVSLTATFTKKLTTNLDAGNVIISSQPANVPDSKVIKVEVFNNTLKININDSYVRVTTPHLSSFYLKYYNNILKFDIIKLNY